MGDGFDLPPYFILLDDIECLFVQHSYLSRRLGQWQRRLRDVHGDGHGLPSLFILINDEILHVHNGRM